MPSKKSKKDMSAYSFALARISIGLVFLWAFFDKLIGLGFSTCRDKVSDAVTVGCSASWLHGGSPTTGFLKFGTSGPLANFYQGLAGNHLIDWIFMLGILGIGVALTLGIAMRLAAISGSILLLLMWSAALWPANNPILDEHIVYIFVLMGLAQSQVNQVCSLSGWWSKQSLPKSFPILR